MTTAPTMLRSRVSRAISRLGTPLIASCCTLFALVACSGTQTERVLTPPRVLVAPYDTTRGETLWAVAPLRNESGTTLIDGFEITDKVILAVEEVRGIRCLPLNRVIETMRSLEMMAVRTPDDAQRLASALRVDGLIVGSITAYDPYNPPRIGLALALYSNSAGSGTNLDTRTLSTQATDASRQHARSSQSPSTVVSAMLDGANHQVLMDVKTYAQGRHDDRSALGWEIYLASMDRYAQFAAHHVVDRLVQNEWLRLTNDAGRQAQAAP
ncbi:MAG: hypothetical protein KF838_08565 [Phycisphaeraceae bacterium]|nr:MAG: hypothetical protein KF838_08565 [Phycisphaeraceae bacterium]